MMYSTTMLYSFGIAGKRGRRRLCELELSSARARVVRALAALAAPKPSPPSFETVSWPLRTAISVLQSPNKPQEPCDAVRIIRISSEHIGCPIVLSMA